MRNPRVWNRKDGESEYLKVFTEPYMPQEPVLVVSKGKWTRGSIQSCIRTTMIADRAYRLKVKVTGLRISSVYFCDGDGYGAEVLPVRDPSGRRSPG